MQEDLGTAVRTGKTLVRKPLARNRNERVSRFAPIVSDSQTTGDYTRRW
jgi:hypothetical protein